MIEDLVPAVVAVVERTGDPPGLRAHPAEEASVARAAAGRRAEFVTGRHCARTALARLGLAPAAIVTGPRGAPVWPPGVVGSITHCPTVRGGFRSAAVARTADLATIGIDAEPHEPLPAGVLATIALPRERTRLAALGAGAPATAWDRVLFSAKESVYKAWFPLTGSWLDFEAADVTIDPVAGRFTARLLVPGPVVAGVRWRGFTGRFAVRDGLVLTAVAGGSPDV